MTLDPRYEDFLEAISRCFIDRNFSGWRARVLFPFSLITSAGPVILTDERALKANFDLYLQACDTLRLDDIVRVPRGLENCRDGTWIGTYETNLLSHGVRATAPYISSALMRLVDGEFRMHSVLNARGHHEWTGLQPPA